MLAACEILKKAKCDQGMDGLLALSGGVDSAKEPHHCWPLHFEAWVKGGCGCNKQPKCTCPKTFPKSNEAQYLELLKGNCALPPSRSRPVQSGMSSIHPHRKWSINARKMQWSKLMTAPRRFSARPKAT